MTNTALHSAIRTRFGTLVQDVLSLSTIYDGDPTRPPTDGSPWCRCAIRSGDSEQVEAGPASFRKHGQVLAQLFGPLDRGCGDLLGKANTIEVAFQGQSAGGVRYGPVTVRTVGQVGGECQVNVEIPFMAD
jgi:hypothetical protein